MSLQSCPTLCSPIDGSPPGSPILGILQARTLEWVAIFFSNAWKWKVKVRSLSRVRLFTTPWTVAYQAFPSMGFSRQEYWSGMPSPSLFIPFFFIASKNYSFTYFWPHWIFAVGHSLSLAVESRGYSLAEVYGLLRLPSTGSTVWRRSRSLWAQ